MIFDTFLIPAMAQAAEQSTIKAIPVGLRWNGKSNASVLFKGPNGDRCFTVMDVCVSSWREYNLMFKRRTFTISLNEVGLGFHQAKGIRWDDSMKQWVEVRKPESYLDIEQYTRFGVRTEYTVQYVWDCFSCEWEEVSIHLPQILYRRVGDDNLKCFDCHSGNRQCHCPSVLDLQQKLMGYSQHVRGTMCGTCGKTHKTPDCLVCAGDYTPASLEGKEPFCPICHRSHDLDECVAVEGGCIHGFHEDCIERWRFQINNCPVCRAEYPPILMDDGNSNDSNSFDGDSSDGDYNDPMDDCSNCGNPRCPCQYRNRRE